MATPADPHDDLLADRYGRPDPRARLLVVAAVSVLAVAGLFWLVWAAWLHSTPDVRGELAGFTVTSDHEVHVVIEARRSSGAAIDCTVKALSDSHAVVGQQTVTIPAGEPGDVRFEADVSTDRLATTVQVSDCR